MSPRATASTPSSALTRRSLLLGGAGGLAAALAGCSADAVDQAAAPSSAAPGPSSSSASGPWSFTDDRGTTTSLPSRPLRVAGYGDALSALMAYGITPVGVWLRNAVAADPNFSDRDLTGIEVLGTAYGEIDLEALAALAPDVLVTTDYPTNGTYGETIYSFADTAQQERALKVAPIVSIGMTGRGDAVVERLAGLATALGADTSSAEVQAARAGLTTATTALSEAAARTGVRVGVLYATPSEGLYWARPAQDPALAWYASLGLQFAPLAESTEYWETASWENAGRYTPDVIFTSTPDGLDLAGLRAQPTMASTPAVAAGQVHPWRYGSLDPVRQARIIGDFATQVGASRRLT